MKLHLRLTVTLLVTAASCWVLPRAFAIAHTILVEAEGFSARGGWVVDPQFMDQMGSPYLLAHGLGRPVPDASTTVSFPQPGAYRVFVRTKDWVAPWKAPGQPGRFQLLVNGKALDTTFGTTGAEWHWQPGGTVRIEKGGLTALALHDLTGFEGRCDAILFTTDATLVPPNAGREMASFRRQLLGWPEEPERAGEFDLVVVGGGIAGTCAAVSAARLGLKVALVQDRPVLGGNNSSEVRVWLQGARSKEPWPRVGDVVAELEQDKRAHYGPANTAELYEDAKKLGVVRAEPNLRLFLEHRANQVVAVKGTLRAVIAQQINTGRRFQINGRWFADCTGDASIGELAGADFEMQPTGRMGQCNLWNVCECQDTNALNTAVTAGSAPAPFPRCPWALDLSDKPFPGRSKTQPDTLKLGGWYWESGFDRDPIREMEYIRDWNFRAMYGAWDAMKNVDKVLPNHRLNWAAHILGKRESRRLLGDVVLSLDDLKTGRKFPDGCVPTGWKVDLHLADGRYEKGFEGDGFISAASFGAYPMPFWIPYRCLYSRNVSNLFMAGRNISVTHEALGAVRVMRTGGCMGEIVGMAASLCRKHDVAPRLIHERHLGELQELMRRGAGKSHASPEYDNQGEPPAKRMASRASIQPTPPAWLAQAGPNLARSARVSGPDGDAAARSSASLLNDGRLDLSDNSQRWLGKAPLPQPIEFTWDQPQTINAARIVSGFSGAGHTLTGAVTGFKFQYQEDAVWKDFGPVINGNTQVDWHATFDAVKSPRVRVVIMETPLSIARLWEIEFYGRQN